jgi:hypothetical protein
VFVSAWDAVQEHVRHEKHTPSSSEEVYIILA